MICTEIKKYITENGIKFAFVAEKSGMSANVFSGILNGKRSLKAEEYVNICRALNVPLDKFVK